MTDNQPYDYNTLRDILQRLERIEDHVKHIRYGDGQAFAQEMLIQALKPAHASPADPQAQRTDRA